MLGTMLCNGFRTLYFVANQWRYQVVQRKHRLPASHAVLYTCYLCCACGRSPYKQCLHITTAGDFSSLDT
jgi:hypothetical protein